MKKFISKKTVIIAVAVVVVGIVLWAIFGRDKGPEIDFVIAERGELFQEVSVTGRVKPAESVNLAFEKSGRVAYVNVDVGDKVWVGNTLVSLENGDIVAQLRQAEANVKAQEAKLDELVRGSRPEEISVQEIKVQNAEASIKDAGDTLEDVLDDAYTKVDDAIRNKVDQFFSNPRGSSPQINFVVNDYQLELDVEAGRELMESVLVSWHVSDASDNLKHAKSFLDKVALAVNAAEPSGTLTQTIIDGYKADVSTARTNINTAISNLSSAEEGLSDAASTLALEKKELDLLLAGTAPEQILAQRAKVEEAKASVSNYQAQVRKTLIISPINGVVTKQDAKVGEIVPANTVVVSLISASKFEIETQIPEADIAKVELGDEALVTLDAYEEDVVFEAVVSSIDPAETIIEGVPTYKAVLQFKVFDKRIKSGMTADIMIATEGRSDVIAVPGRAVKTLNGDKTVRIVDKDSGEIREVLVETGMRGSDGRIEITSGIAEGDKIIVFLEGE